MICAPSNAAIDEIITRIKTKGLINENGEYVKGSKNNFYNKIIFLI
jgi:hypothetical protein